MENGRYKIVKFGKKDAFHRPFWIKNKFIGMIGFAKDIRILNSDPNWVSCEFYPEFENYGTLCFAYVKLEKVEENAIPSRSAC